MSKQTWKETLLSRIADATQIANSTSESLMVPDTMIPANYFESGRILRARMTGVISNVVTTPGTLTFRARWGGLAGTLLCSTGALTQHTTAHTNAPFDLEWEITCRAHGSSGSLLTAARLVRANAATPFLPDLAPAEGTSPVVSSLDLAAAIALSFTAQFSVATNPTNLTVQKFSLESEN